MESLSRLLGVSLIWPAGRWGLPVPKRVPVTIIIGGALDAPSKDPIAEPPEEMIDDMHKRLMKEVEAMYYKWRDAAGYGGIDLEII